MVNVVDNEKIMNNMEVKVTNQKKIENWGNYIICQSCKATEMYDYELKCKTLTLKIPCSFIAAFLFRKRDFYLLISKKQILWTNKCVGGE